MDKPLHYLYCNSNSILVVNHKGLLRKLYTPFKVQCILPIDNLDIGMLVYVEEVRNTPRDELIYIIYTKEYYHFHFCILIGF